MFNNYDLKYIIKKILIGVGIILIMTFINKCDVNAANATLQFGNMNENITIPKYGQFYINNSGSLSQMTTNNYIQPPLPFYSTIDTLPANGWGGAFVFNLDNALAKGYTYSLTVYFGSNNSSRSIMPADYYKTESGYVKLGLYGADAVNRFANKTATTHYSQTSFTEYPIQYDANGNFVQSGYYTNYIYYIFTPDMNATTLLLPIQSYQVANTSYTMMYGYKIEVLGNTNGLTSSDIENIINNSGLATSSQINNINNRLTTIQNTENQIKQEITEVNNSVDKVNDTINDDDVSGANSQVDSLLQNDAFNDSTGIQSIINAPLNFINGLSNSCSPIQLTIPYIDSNVSIPCIKQELTNRVPTIVPILSTAINGFIIYRILLDVVYIIKSAKNPDDDRIEVLDL